MFTFMPIAVCVLATSHRARVSRPPPESLIWWQAIGDGLKPSPYCSIKASCLLPSAFFTRHIEHGAICASQQRFAIASARRLLCRRQKGYCLYSKLFHLFERVTYFCQLGLVIQLQEWLEGSKTLRSLQ